MHGKETAVKSRRRGLRGSQYDALDAATEYVNREHPLPRCEHGGALWDHSGERLEPSCGCRASVAALGAEEADHEEEAQRSEAVTRPRPTAERLALYREALTMPGSEAYAHVNAEWARDLLAEIDALRAERTGLVDTIAHVRGLAHARSGEQTEAAIDRYVEELHGITADVRAERAAAAAHLRAVLEERLYVRRGLCTYECDENHLDDAICAAEVWLAEREKKT